MGNPLIQLEQVSKQFNGTKSVAALAQLNFHITEGDFLVILGPSGCGKTTLLRILAGLESTTTGIARFAERIINGPSLERSLVFQDPRLFPWLTVEGNIGLAGNVPYAVIQNLLADMQLQDFQHAYPHELSGGMAKRVALARALATNPRLLLLDEPFANLDLPTKIQMQKLIGGIWHQGLTCVLVTHDVNETLMVGSRVIMLSGRPGRVVQDIPIDLPFPRDPDSTEYAQWKRVIIDWYSEVA